MTVSPSGRSPAAVAIWALLALFTAYLLWVNRSYNIANTRPPTYDDAWYLESSLHFYHQLTNEGFKAFLSAYASSFRTKAPLISVLPIPFYLLFGTGYQTALLVNSLFVVIANLFLFLLVRRLFSPGIALAAVAFYQTMPLAYGLSRTFFPDYGLAALVIVWLYYLVAAQRLTRGPANFALGVVLGLGLLMKILFPAFIAGPLLVVLYDRHKDRPSPAAHHFWLWRLCARWPLAAILVPGAAMASTWYVFHVRAILTYAWQGAYGEIGSQYGGGLAHWAALAINRGASFYYAAALLILGTAALLVNRQRLSFDHRAALLAAWLAPPLLAIASGRNREIRFLISLLPAVATLLSLAVFHLGRHRNVQVALAVLLLIFPERLFAALSYRPLHHGHSEENRLGPFVLFSRDLGWARPPSSEGHWDQQRILEALRRLAPPSSRPRYVVVGVEHPYLNANLLSYFNAYTQYPLRFTSLGYAEASADAAVARIWEFDARFLLMQDGLHDHDLPPFLNQVNQQIQGRLDRGELPFRLRARVALHAPVTAVVYERDAPWARFAPGAPYQAPAHPLSVEFAGGARFLGYQWSAAGSHLIRFSSFWTTMRRADEDYALHLELHRDGRAIQSEEYFIAGGRYPFPDWTPGETVRQDLLVYLPPEHKGAPLDARLWLSAWGTGAPHQITAPPELVHESLIPLKLER